MLKKTLKLTPQRVKDLDTEKREVVIAFASYGSLDIDKDKANKGMFTKSWKDNREHVRFFLNHDKKQAPGKIVDFNEDDEHGYVRVKMGRHTLGQDTLYQIEDGIIKDASYGFDPVKYDRIPGKGYDYKEVFWHEASVLTHWGAHSKSGIISVVKHFDADKLKELSESEKAFLRKLVANREQALQMSVDMSGQVTEGSDLWEYINDLIGGQSYDVAYLKRKLQYGVKELKELKDSIPIMEKFIKNTKASDETITKVEYELKQVKELLSLFDTDSTEAGPGSLQQHSSGNDEGALLKQLHLLNLKLKTNNV